MMDEETKLDLIVFQGGPLDGDFANRSWVDKDGFVVRRIRVHKINNDYDVWRIAHTAMQAARRAYYRMEGGRLIHKATTRI